MDSGNSGSLQTSSGGDDEFDSRTDSISSFLNSSAFNQPLPTAAPPPQQQHHHHQQLLSHHHQQGGNNFFSQNLDQFQSLPNHHFAQQNHNQQSQNNDHLWSRSVRPDSGNHGNHFGGINPQSILNNTQLTQQQQLPPQQQPSSHLPADANAAAKGGGGGENNHQPATAVKNPKKRTRASRRAPTTVLTTDTSNFRQMVQEFTGIPTAPFSGAGGSPYSRGRLDLFSTGTSNMGPLYPLRPSAQKAQHHQNSFIDSANSQNHLLNMQQQNHILSFNPNNPNTNPNPNPINHNNIPSFLLAGKNPGMMNNVGSNNVNSSSLPSYDELGLGQNVNAAGAHVSSGIWREGGATAAGAAAHVSSYAAAPEFLQHEKGNLENVTSGEGTVGSWICPSD